MLEIKIIGGDAKIRMEIWHCLMLAIHLAKTLCWLMSRPCQPNCESGFFKLINKDVLFVCQYLTYIGFFWRKNEKCHISQQEFDFLLTLIVKILGQILNQLGLHRPLKNGSWFGME